MLWGLFCMQTDTVVWTCFWFRFNEKSGLNLITALFCVKNQLLIKGCSIGMSHGGLKMSGLDIAAQIRLCVQI